MSEPKYNLYVLNRKYPLYVLGGSLLIGYPEKPKNLQNRYRGSKNCTEGTPKTHPIGSPNAIELSTAHPIGDKTVPSSTVPIRDPSKDLEEIELRNLSTWLRMEQINWFQFFELVADPSKASKYRELLDKEEFTLDYSNKIA